MFSVRVLFVLKTLTVVLVVRVGGLCQSSRIWDTNVSQKVALSEFEMAVIFVSMDWPKVYSITPKSELCQISALQGSVTVTEIKKAPGVRFCKGFVKVTAS